MGIPEKYNSIIISSAVEVDQLPEKVLDLLSRWIKSPRERIKVALDVGTIKLSKVPASSDVEKLVRVLEKGGLRFQITPLEPDAPTEVRAHLDSGPAAFLLPKTMTRATGGGVSLPSIQGRDEANWKKGDVIEGLYEVFGSAAGGMGKVYFVFHRLWKMMLAIKTPLRAAVKNEARLLRFLREAELWVDLGLHPNIATC